MSDSPSPGAAVAPLDAYVTAKPDEPTFTLQGGDPLAAPLVRFWATLARVSIGLLSPAIAAQEMSDLINTVLCDLDVLTLHEQKELQLRATKAEEVSWQMDSYRRGHTSAEEPETPAENFLDAQNRLDIYDVRRRAVSCFNNANYELRQFVEALEALKWQQPAIIEAITQTADRLSALSSAVAIKRQHS